MDKEPEKMNTIELFPTLFFETYINTQLAIDILSEIKKKEPEIRNISEASQSQPIKDYSTDFCHPVEIELFDRFVTEHMCKEFKKINYDVEMKNSWVSCYTGAHGAHAMHNHSKGWNGNGEYACILYLSDIGKTDFFNTSLISDNYIKSIKSRMGKVIVFPGIIPHQFVVDKYDGNSRYTLAFNISLTKS